jgi:N-acetylglucosamine kinase-like BadF-type ATPase
VDSVVGIDAGGSRIRVVAIKGDTVVHRGAGGPGNPHTVSARELEAHYSTALDGCPPARSVVLCAAGAGSRVGRERLRGALAPALRGARLVVLPDYAAAWSIAPAGTEIVAIAGTGSVIASRDSAAGYVVTGGAGAIGGDPGSALRLGRAALAHAGLGGGGRAAADVARHATQVTGAAKAGEDWAVETLRSEMATFAEDVRLHATRIGRGRCRSRVATTGGVFSSPEAAVAFSRALGPSFEVVRMPSEPVMGAVRIARELGA